MWSLSAGKSPVLSAEITILLPSADVREKMPLIELIFSATVMAVSVDSILTIDIAASSVSLLLSRSIPSVEGRELSPTANEMYSYPDAGFQSPELKSRLVTVASVGM